MLKFKKNGQTKAILKDEAAEPEGIVYKDTNELSPDIVIPEDAKSVEEIEAELLEQDEEIEQHG